MTVVMVVVIVLMVRIVGLLMLVKVLRMLRVVAVGVVVVVCVMVRVVGVCKPVFIGRLDSLLRPHTGHGPGRTRGLVYYPPADGFDGGFLRGWRALGESEYSPLGGEVILPLMVQMSNTVGSEK